MKCFHETEYTVYNDLVKNTSSTHERGTVRICVLSDLHYSDLISEEQLNSILERVRALKPDYILFCGGMVDSVDDINAEILIKWWNELRKIAPGLISIGSHDYWKCYVNQETGAFYGKEEYPNWFFDELDNLPDVKVLNNDIYDDENLFALGYTQSLDYYYSKEIAKKTIFSTITEDKDVMIRELTELIEKFENDISSDNLNLLLVHALTYGFTEEVMKLFAYFAYVFGGHAHNGLVLPGLNEIWPSKRGLITPDRRILQDNVRNTLRKETDKVIVNGPLTTFQKCSGTITKFNIFYPMNLTVINITNNISYRRDKIYTKQKYVPIKK